MRFDQVYYCKNPCVPICAIRLIYIRQLGKCNLDRAVLQSDIFE